jgi:hypothetical protein
VDRAVDYAYQTRAQFPDRRIFLVGEIIHNPHVNRRLREMGITFLYPAEEGPDAGGEFDFSGIGPEDVVILPAFGVTLPDFQRLREIGCILVDTTCGSVLNVWKRVDQYARDGFTALIHGKYYHEETKATASQVFKHPGGKPTSSSATWTRRAGDGLHRAGPRRALARRSWSTSARRRRPASIPTCTCSGSAARTRRRCWPASRSRSRPRSGSRWSAATAGSRTSTSAALPLLRHHLLGHAGAAGRGARR